MWFAELLLQFSHQDLAAGTTGNAMATSRETLNERAPQSPGRAGNEDKSGVRHRENLGAVAAEKKQEQKTAGKSSFSEFEFQRKVYDALSTVSVAGLRRRLRATPPRA